jgi:type II secretory pathway pseudopilin PulG
MKMQKLKLRFKSEQGFTLIDVIVSLGIIVLLFGGIFLAYMSITDLVNNLEVRGAASSVLNDQVEIVRNLSYANVGVVGGVPGGVIPATQNVVHGDLTFVIKTTVRNIDDPYDGTLGGTPNDTAPADYKLVELEASCPNCRKFVPLILTTTVAPKNLESASTDGSLFLNVFDANGQPVSGATVRVQNASVTPAIDLTDQTNLNGILQLVGVPTSTQAYFISVTKSGFSTDRTYPMGASGNPNPVKPHATVAAQTVTTLSFAIDGLSTVNVQSVGSRCEPKASRSFSITGTKLIGTAPDVLKFSTSSQTDAQGLKSLTGVEWDNYGFALTGSGDDLLGTIPFSTVAVNPSSTFNFQFVVQPASPRALLVKVVDGVTGLGVSGAQVLAT